MREPAEGLLSLLTGSVEDLEEIGNEFPFSAINRLLDFEPIEMTVQEIANFIYHDSFRDSFIPEVLDDDKSPLAVGCLRAEIIKDGEPYDDPSMIFDDPKYFSTWRIWKEK